jgi:hypothetical protein
VLNSIPLFTSILGVLFLVVMLSSKGVLAHKKRALTALVIIVLMAIHSQIDGYLYFNGIESFWVGLSWLHYHLMGGFFLFFTHRFSGIELNVKRWTIILVAFTVFRVLFLIPEDTAAYENYSETLGWVDLGIILDNFLSNGLNIMALYLAFIKIRKLNFAVEPDKKGKISYAWLKSLLAFQTGLYISIVALSIISFFYAEQWLTFWKIESMISGFFFFVLAFFAIRFPLFSVYGDFQDLGTEERKYAKSSLNEYDSDRIWKDINDIMVREKLYRNPAYRLNDLANQLDQ